MSRDVVSPGLEAGRLRINESFRGIEEQTEILRHNALQRIRNEERQTKHAGSAHTTTLNTGRNYATNATKHCSHLALHGHTTLSQISAIDHLLEGIAWPLLCN